ncbi:hypothetical protein CEXT_78021 [Caerostris extrusa]|uniref:Uncharacterized protein n=1 Tax=Caerostris extrusa TaxID=172846 RepID=A0AAV4QKW6_CAEEX|nr:hypothetical protein CEXT_78021 [Caerostris extrusa]
MYTAITERFLFIYTRIRSRYLSLPNCISNHDVESTSPEIHYILCLSYGSTHFRFEAEKLQRDAWRCCEVVLLTLED